MKRKKKKGMNAGNIETSERLRKTYLILLYNGKKGLTTMEIQKHTKSQAVHSDISALRKNGLNIPPAEYVCLRNGRRIFRYWVEP